MNRMYGAIAIATVLWLAPGVAAQQGGVSKAQVDTWMTELSNWGRWGKDDQRGTLNLITAETRKAAVKLVREGISVSLAHTIEKTPAADSPRPIGQER